MLTSRHFGLADKSTSGSDIKEDSRRRTPAAPGAGIFERKAHASYLLGQMVNFKLGETNSRPTHVDSGHLSNTLQSLSSLLKHDIDTVNGPYYRAAEGICDRHVEVSSLPDVNFADASPFSALLALHAPSIHSQLRVSLVAFRKIPRTHPVQTCCRSSHELGVTFFTNIHWLGLIGTIAPLVPDSSTRLVLCMDYWRERRATRVIAMRMI